MQVALLLLLVGCDTRPLPAPPEPSASAAPIRSAPFNPLTPIIASASASASAAPSIAPPPGMPPLERACTKDTDCASTFYDTLCCTDCMPRLGNKTSVKQIDAFCKDNKPKECPKPPPCGFVFGAPRCNNGQCIAH